MKAIHGWFAVTVLFLIPAGAFAGSGQHILKKSGTFTYDIYGYDNTFGTGKAAPIEKLSPEEIACAKTQLNIFSEVLNSRSEFRKFLGADVKIDVDVAFVGNGSRENQEIYNYSGDSTPAARRVIFEPHHVYLRPWYWLEHRKGEPPCWTLDEKEISEQLYESSGLKARKEDEAAARAVKSLEGVMTKLSGSPKVEDLRAAPDAEKKPGTVVTDPQIPRDPGAGTANPRAPGARESGT